MTKPKTKASPKKQKKKWASVHISPTGGSWWVEQSHRKLPLPITTIRGKAKWRKRRTRLVVPKGLRNFAVAWITPKHRSFYVPKRYRRRFKWKKDNCGGSGGP